MDYYYVTISPQPNGDHEVHKKGCTYCPDENNRLYLGYFTNCHDAVRKAKEYFRQVDGCRFCSQPCHIR